MTEDYLNYIWKFLKFNQLKLRTTNNEEIQLIKQGTHNLDSGPDFSNATANIAGVEWHGSIEIHIKSSDWNKHRHQFDPAYNNVILHVVYEDDQQVRNEHNESIPTVVIKELIDESAYLEYEQFLNKGSLRPCSNMLESVPKLTIISLLDEMLISRLMRKSNEISRELKSLNGDWEETFHRFLFKYLGMKVNGEAMLELARRTPYQLIHKNGSLFTIESLLFGQAGMLNDSKEDEYYLSLREEYLYLKQKYQLQSMNSSNWKFSKMRPPNFPTLRIAQIASIHASYQGLFQIIRDKQPIGKLQHIFGELPSEYWQKHYTFKTESKFHKGNIGKAALESLIINVVAPFSFVYGREIGDDSFEDYAFLLLESLPAELNRITRKYSDVKLEMINAKESQSFIQLHDQLCLFKKCLNCKIGVSLMQ